jgi:hypothetical protein
MHNENPLGTWLVFDDDVPLLRDMLGQAEVWLGDVARALEQPKPRYPPAPFSHFPVRLPPALRQRAEALFPRVWKGGGTSKQNTELGLLSLVGFAADPASLPFWKEAVALTQRGDKTASKRREMAAAGLAFTAHRHPGSGALAALEALTLDAHSDTRTAATDCLAHLAVNEDSPAARPAREILQRLAREPGPFETRFLARRFLVRSGEPLPPYDTGDAIAFEVAFDDVRRTIELEADQTLVDLHCAILDAFHWDTDHLHQFSLNGDLRDDRFSIPAPDEDSPPFTFGELSGADEGRDPPEEGVFPLGAMGLTVGHQIAYLYDFGDSNVFQIEVAGVHPKSPRAKYPRVTAKVGKAPEQYAS